MSALDQTADLQARIADGKILTSDNLPLSRVIRASPQCYGVLLSGRNHSSTTCLLNDRLQPF
jgi:hypothetical protein